MEISTGVLNQENRSCRDTYLQNKSTWPHTHENHNKLLALVNNYNLYAWSDFYRQQRLQ